MITFGMIVAGIGVLLFLRSGVDATYWDILPAFIVMGFGMSFIWAPMTTAVLNSVPSDKSGIASAINGAIREIGTAFGIALLGTLANTTYKNSFKDDATIQTLSASGDAAVQAALNFVGNGASEAGHVLEKTPMASTIPADVLAQIRDASSLAFIDGMDLAMIFGASAMILAGVISYFLVNDEVFVTKPEPVIADQELSAQPAD